MDNTRLALLKFHLSYIRDAKNWCCTLRNSPLPPQTPVIDDSEDREVFNKCFLAQMTYMSNAHIKRIQWED